MAKYVSTKTYTHLGPVAYRQWRADSHCNLIHGYALSFHFEFECDTLDARNWCMDFGGLKPLKANLEDWFDHTLLVAEDDPEMDTVQMLQDKTLIDMRIVDAVGCERFAELTFNKAQSIIEAQYGKRCWVESVTVREHEHNSATVRRIHA